MEEILAYNEKLPEGPRAIAQQLMADIALHLPEAEGKIWHGHPVWFLGRNPVVGYSMLKSGLRLLFWSGQSFEEEGLVAEGKFKAAEFRFLEGTGYPTEHLPRWLQKAREIQWDYANLVKRKGELHRLL